MFFPWFFACVPNHTVPVVSATIFSHSPPSAKSRFPFCCVPCAHYPMPHSHFLIHNSIINLGCICQIALYYIYKVLYYNIIINYILLHWITYVKKNIHIFFPATECCSQREKTAVRSSLPSQAPYSCVGGGSMQPTFSRVFRPFSPAQVLSISPHAFSRIFRIFLHFLVFLPFPAYCPHSSAILAENMFAYFIFFLHLSEFPGYVSIYPLFCLQSPTWVHKKLVLYNQHECFTTHYLLHCYSPVYPPQPSWPSPLVLAESPAVFPRGSASGILYLL